MARSQQIVTKVDPEISRLPDWAAAGAALVADWRHRGRLEELGERLQIQRQGGYSGIDVVLFLMYRFQSDLRCSIRKFWERASAFGVPLAALADRSSLASSSAISRALKQVEPSLLRRHAPWLLSEASGCDAVLKHPSTQVRDACGNLWFGVDMDPTVTAVIHRALPAGEDLPPGKRRTTAITAAGHRGRKRGTGQFRRAPSQHIGSAVYLDARLAPGNGDARGELRAAVDVVRSTSLRLGYPLSLLRVDGEFGGVPSYTACREAGVAFITRLSRPEMFDDPEIRQKLATATWVCVPSDRSGVARSAADLGVVRLYAGHETRRDDGSEYEPIDVRVVVSRYERTTDAEHGRVLDGWQYEMFAADVPADAWPAVDVVAFYFGRAAIENRFAQEDRELELDRILSEHPPGQELACVIGMMCWNWRIAQGFQLDKIPDEPVPPTPRDDVVDPRPVPASLQPPARPPEVESPTSPTPSLRQQLEKEFHALPWDDLLRNRPNWRLDPDERGLRCPEGKLLVFNSVEDRTNERAILNLRGARGACDGCPVRKNCFASEVACRPKLVKVSVRPDEMLREGVWRDARGKARGARRKPPPQLLDPSSSVSIPGPFAMRTPLFLPAEARHLTQVTLYGSTLHMDVHLPERERLPLLMARDVARRQHRRLTWTERLARYALPAAATVHIRIAASPAAQRLLHPQVAEREAAA